MIWAMTGAGFFWPVFPIMGWAIGVAAKALGRLQNAYGRDVPTETEVRRDGPPADSRLTPTRDSST